MKNLIKVFNASSTLRPLGHKKFVFNGGEVSVKITDKLLNKEIDEPFFITVKAHIANAEGIMELLLLDNALEELCKQTSMEVSTNCEVKKSLIIPYIPYGRQDRVCDKGESFSLKVMANLINSMGYNVVITHDPHSDVTPALINNLFVLDQAEIFSDHIKALPDPVLIAPDGGAMKKTFKIAKTLGIPMFTAEKVRDVRDGSILETRINFTKEDIRNKDVVVVDDICDGGRTFVELAKKIPTNLNTLHLMVTHGIFSKGLNELEEYYDSIYTTPSVQSDVVVERQCNIITT